MGYAFRPDAGWRPANRYINIREPDGSLVTREKYGSSGDFIYSRIYHFDGLGSTMALSDENGIVTDTYKYDVWGNLIPPPDPESTLDNPYQYVGQLGYYTHYQEPDLGLLQLGVRYYDTEKGRFTQRDWLKDEVNSYLYVSACPLNLADPTGLAHWFRYDDMRDWYNPKHWFAYSHAWLKFDEITCLGSKTAGFWSTGIKMPDPRHKKYTSQAKKKNLFVEKYIKSELFERFLCDCIKDSRKKPPKYSDKAADFYVCGSWAQDMWNCADTKYWAYKKVMCSPQGAKGLEPKTPPGGD